MNNNNVQIVNVSSFVVLEICQMSNCAIISDFAGEFLAHKSELINGIHAALKKTAMHTKTNTEMTNGALIFSEPHNLYTDAQRRNYEG